MIGYSVIQEKTNELIDEINQRVIAEKVEMLSRHTKLGQEMQDMALDYLKENVDELSSPAAIRLLVEGIRIERESRGVPEALEKISKMSDEQLLSEVKKIVSQSPVIIEPNE